MELREFEQAILKLAFETNARITTASVAYYLGVPSRQANRLLNELLEEGVLELDSDPSGNLFYKVPNQPEEAALDQIKGVREQIQAEHFSGPPRQPPPLPRQLTHERLVTIEDTEAPAYEPRPFIAPDGDHGRPAPPQGRDGFSSSAIKKIEPSQRFRPSLTKSARPDASVNRCGSSAMIVSTEARCDTRPLPTARPVLVSCNEGEEAHTPASPWFHEEAKERNYAMVPYDQEETALEVSIAQPEHQPGMALLLSLILCGTGQIYNGEVSKGIMMMVLCFLLWFVLLGWVVHIWSIVDAVVVAEKLNRRTPSDSTALEPLGNR